MQILFLAEFRSSHDGFVPIAARGISDVAVAVSGKGSRLKLEVEQVVEALLLAAVVEHGANFKLISLIKRLTKTLMALYHCRMVCKPGVFKGHI